MFRKVAVPILGIVENMSTFVCPNCGHESQIFAHGGARREAERLDVPFLGEVPLRCDPRDLRCGPADRRVGARQRVCEGVPRNCRKSLGSARRRQPAAALKSS